MSAQKRQQMVILQRALDKKNHFLDVRAPTIDMTGILKINLSLGVFPYHCNKLCTGLYQLCIAQHNLSTCNILKSHTNQQLFISRGSGPPTLVDEDLLIEPYRINLPDTLKMVWSSHACLRALVANLLGWDIPTTQDLATFRKYMSIQEMEHEYYIP